MMLATSKHVLQIKNCRDFVCVFKTRTAKHKMTSQVSVADYGEFVHVVQCYLMKCKKRNHNIVFTM